MIHQQHPVHPIPRNQLPRDAASNNVNRMAHSQMSMRVSQPGMGAQQQTQRAHTISMQQTSSNVAGSSTETDSAASGLRVQASPAASPSHAATSGGQEPAVPPGGENSPATTTSAVSTQDGEQQQSNTTQPNDLANTKEKTPMCLINELARHNKLTHQYRLTSETGPAHRKCFTVTLKLGEEEYTAEGPSIKKAQHTAAANALTSTRYSHPPPKTQRVLRVRKVNITPTVELNALAMKRGEPTSYNFLEPMPTPYPPNYFRGMSYQRYHYNKPMYGPAMFFVSLKVGDREYSGQGRTAQAARHDAASKALAEIRQLPMPEGVTPVTATNGQDGTPASNEVHTETEPGSDLKSPISLVHEIALKRSMAVSFEVVREKGPPHMRTFLTNCRVGELICTEGEGNSKKTSKKRAAEQMLEILKKLPALSPPTLVTPQRLKRSKPTAVKKKTRNLIKEQKVKQEYVDDINPISRLIQIQQARKEREPEYSLLEERGVPRRREFIMEVTVGQHSCTGTGPNKKMAKRAAAEALLQLMGLSRPGESSVGNPGKPGAEVATTGAQQSADKTRKVTFLEDSDSKEGNSVPSPGVNLQPGGSGGRQLVPGLLLMTQHDNSKTSGFSGKGVGVNGPSSGSTRQMAAVIAKELLSCGSSPTAEVLVAAGQMQSSSKPAAVAVPAAANQSQTATSAVTTPATPVTTAGTPRPKELLNYLSNLLKFSVTYTDFPKVNHSEFLSLVSLSTNPPQVFHGAGPTTDASHDQAARTALQVLSEMGLDTVNNNPGGETGVQSGADNDGKLHGLKSNAVVVTSNGNK